MTWVIAVNPKAEFDVVRRSLTAALKPEAKALHGRNVRLAWGDRPLDLMDVRRLASQLRDEFQASVVAVECTADRIHQYAEHSFKLKFLSEGMADPVRMPLGFAGAPSVVEPVDPPTPAVPDAEDVPCDAPAVEPPLVRDQAEDLVTDVMAESMDEAIPTDLPEAEFGDVLETDIVEVVPVIDDSDLVPAEGGRRVLVLERTIRSGSVIRFAGDVAVFGDVNAGAHIEADGNIIVMGALRGLAHAGARGDQRSIILAFELGSPQLRIARCMCLTGETERPPSVLDTPPALRSRIPMAQLTHLLRRDRVERRQFNPQVAWIEGGTIQVDTYNGRLPT